MCKSITEAIQSIAGVEIRAKLQFANGNKITAYITALEGKVVEFKKYWKSDVTNCFTDDIQEIDIPNMLEFLKERKVR